MATLKRANGADRKKSCPFFMVSKSPRPCSSDCFTAKREWQLAESREVVFGRGLRYCHHVDSLVAFIMGALNQVERRKVAMFQSLEELQGRSGHVPVAGMRCSRAIHRRLTVNVARCERKVNMAFIMSALKQAKRRGATMFQSL